MLLLYVTLIALGRAAFCGMAVFTYGFMGAVFGYFDFSGLTFMTGVASHFIGMTFVIEGNDPFAFVGDNVGSKSGCSDKSGEHY
jgi:hypothetical protein